MALAPLTTPNNLVIDALAVNPQLGEQRRGEAHRTVYAGAVERASMDVCRGMRVTVPTQAEIQREWDLEAELFDEQGVEGVERRRTVLQERYPHMLASMRVQEQKFNQWCLTTTKRHRAKESELVVGLVIPAPKRVRRDGQSDQPVTTEVRAIPHDTSRLFYVNKVAFTPDGIVRLLRK